MAKILVVEDERLMRRLVENILKDEYKITIAEDGGKGLEEFVRGNPDLVLTDLEMPGMGGLELARKIRDINPDQKIIIMSGNTGLEGLQVPKGVVKLKKPFGPQELLDNIARILAY